MKNPFVGLRPFELSEGHLFFGRQKEVGVLINHILTLPVLIVYARSGTGKSSLLNAGIGPHLAKDDSQVPIYIETTQSDVTAAVREGLRRSGWRGQKDLSLRGMLNQHWLETDKRAVVIIDQFEERLNNGMDHTDLYSAISRMVNENSDAACIVVSIREDYLGMLEPLMRRVPGLLTASYRIPPLSREALEQAIYGPVGSESSVAVDPGLVAATLEDLHQSENSSGIPGQQVFEPGYFQIVWSTLWEKGRQSGRTKLTVKLYRQLGGASEILKNFTTERLGALEPAEAHMFWAMSRYLVLPTGAKVALTVEDLMLLQKKTDYLTISIAEDYGGEREGNVWIADLPTENLTKLARKVLRTLTSSRTPLFQRVIRDGREEFELLHDVLASILLQWRTDFEHAFREESAKQLRSYRTRAINLERSLRRSAVRDFTGEADDDEAAEAFNIPEVGPSLHRAQSQEETVAIRRFIKESTADASRLTRQLPHIGSPAGLQKAIKEGESLLVAGALIRNWSRYDEIQITKSHWEKEKKALAAKIERTALEHSSADVRRAFQDQMLFWASGTPSFRARLKRDRSLLAAASEVILAIVLAIPLSCVPLFLGNWLTLWLLRPLALQYTWLSVGIGSLVILAIYAVLVSEKNQSPRAYLTVYFPTFSATDRERRSWAFLGSWPLPTAVSTGLSMAGALLFHGLGFAATAGFNVGLLVGVIVSTTIIALCQDF